MNREAKDFLIVALDVPTIKKSESIVEELGESVRFYKVGLQLFIRGGPRAVEFLKEKEKKVFLDLKLHDIPNTIKGAVESAIDMGVDMLTVHIAGGLEMMESAQRALRNKHSKKPLILGVTILTSLDEAFLRDTLGIEKSLKNEIIDLAMIARRAGLGGVVASPKETAMIKKLCGEDFIVVTPGIRPGGIEVGDQRRFETPEKAVMDGSDYLVVGRPIIKATNMRKAAESIIQEIKDGL